MIRLELTKCAHGVTRIKEQVQRFFLGMVPPHTRWAIIRRTVSIAANRASIFDRWRPRGALCGGVLALAGVAALGQPSVSPRLQAAVQPAPGVTFSSDVAPILFEHCVVCHRPDSVAGFSLLTYDAARPRARAILQQVLTREMPPWKPEPGYGEFLDERRLSDADISLIERWVETGALEGDPNALPPAPALPTGWQTGQPDLVLTLPAYDTAASDTDEFRNFVVPIPIVTGRYVRGLEFRPGSSAVHHANILIDRTRTSRTLDEADPLPGYQGLIPHSATYPEGYFLGWTPGQTPPLAPPDMAWRLDAGSDLFVQLHLQPTGEPELIQPAVGLFFTDTPPTQRPTIFRLGRQDIDIQPGEASYLSTDAYVLPVDAEVQAVQPHAHYRATEVRGWAELPDGERRELIYIPRWNFHWQDQYRYRDPISLPAGTTLRFTAAYDNSAANRNNPDQPPTRVLWGFRSEDEMGDLWVQVLTRSDEDRGTLTRDVTRKMMTETTVGLEVQMNVRPDYVPLRNDAAVLYLELGQPERAVSHFEVVTRLEPESAAAWYNVGSALVRAGRVDEAISHLEQAVRLDPEYSRARTTLATTLLGRGDADAAVAQFRELVRYAPDDIDGLSNLGYALMQAGRSVEAIAPLEQALELNPRYDVAVYNLAHALANVGRTAEAVARYRVVLVLRPNWQPAMRDLAWVLATDPRAGPSTLTEAISLAGAAAAMSKRQDPFALDALAAAYAAAGRFDDAVATAESALLVAPPEVAAEIEIRLALYRTGQRFSAR